MALAGALVGCGNGDDTAAPGAPAGDGGLDASLGLPTAPPPTIDAECPVIVSDTNCDKTQRPIVFVHGTYAAGDDIANIALLFASNGYCPERFVSIDYNSLIAVGGGLSGGAFTGPTNAATPVIDAAIDAVLAATGASQVDIMGHSQGALQYYQYFPGSRPRGGRSRTTFSSRAVLRPRLPVPPTRPASRRSASARAAT